MTEATPPVAVILARMEGKLDHALAGYTDHEARIRELESHGTKDHGGRLATLERARWPLPSVSILIALGSVGVTVAAVLQR